MAKARVSGDPKGRSNGAPKASSLQRAKTSLARAKVLVLASPSGCLRASVSRELLRGAVRGPRFAMDSIWGPVRMLTVRRVTTRASFSSVEAITRLASAR